MAGSLTLALIAAWLLWRGYGLAAAPAIALLVLIKPFYGLLVATFCLITLLPDGDRWTRLRACAVAALGSLALVGLEILRWHDSLRREAAAYFSRALDHQWRGLPAAQQIPMSAWNRTPLQVLVGWGFDPAVAQVLALAVWGALLLATLWWIRGRRLGFPLAFALTYVLFLWARPVSWTLPYLDLIILSAVWPEARSPRYRAALLTTAAALAFSHWLALAQTLRGVGPDFLTLQTAAWPWETLIVLPAAWLIVMRAVTSSRDGGAERPEQTSISEAQRGT